jgi:hypothetical protein
MSMPRHIDPVWCRTPHDVKRSQRLDEVLVKHRTFEHNPVLVVFEIAAPQFGGARHGLWIKIKGRDPGAEPARGQAEKATSRARVQEREPTEILPLQHGAQRFLRLLDALVVQQAEEAGPVGSELESIPLPHLLGMGCFNASLWRNIC